MSEARFGKRAIYANQLNTSFIGDTKVSPEHIPILIKFRELQTELVEAVQRDNEQQVRSLDRQLHECWLNLLGYMPTNENERVSLIEFFVDQVIANPGSDTLIKQSKDKILTLAAIW